MTFLVAARAKDGLVAPSDRKETIPEPNGNEVSKYCLDVVKGFYLALSGDGVAADPILNELRKSGVSSTVALKEMERLAANTQLARPGHDPVAGHLVVAERGEIELYTVYIEKGRGRVAPNNAAMPTEGDYRAVALCKNLTWGRGSYRHVLRRSGQVPAHDRQPHCRDGWKRRGPRYVRNRHGHLHSRRSRHAEAAHGQDGDDQRRLQGRPDGAAFRQKREGELGNGRGPRG